MNDESVMLKDLSPGDEFRRFSGEHRYVVSSRREEHCGNVKMFCYNLTAGGAYDWAGRTRVVPLRRGGRAHAAVCGEVTRIPICIEKGRKYHVKIQDNEIVISMEAAWEDITKSCQLEFRDSQHCNGRYMVITHDHKWVAIIGTAGIQAQHGFKVEKPAGAWTSFRVLKRNK